MFRLRTEKSTVLYIILRDTEAASAPAMRAAVADVDCYTGSGLEYRGSARRSLAGTECLEWSKTKFGSSFASGGGLNSETISELEVQDILTRGHSACRNYGGGKLNQRPWCPALPFIHFTLLDIYEYITLVQYYYQNIS